MAGNGITRAEFLGGMVAGALALAGCAKKPATSDESAPIPHGAHECEFTLWLYAKDAVTPAVLHLEGCCAKTDGEDVWLAVKNEGSVTKRLIAGKYHVSIVSPLRSDGGLFDCGDVRDWVIDNQTPEEHNALRLSRGETSRPDQSSTSPAPTQVGTFVRETLEATSDGDANATIEGLRQAAAAGAIPASVVNDAQSLLAQ